MLNFAQRLFRFPSVNPTCKSRHRTSIFYPKKNMFPLMQKTIKKSCYFEGLGTHSGLPVKMLISPGIPNQGYIFIRTDEIDHDQSHHFHVKHFPYSLDQLPEKAIIHGIYDRVVDTKMATRIANDYGTQVSTVEHVLAALIGEGITNASIYVSGPEIPIMDGSSALFSNALLNAGTVIEKQWVLQHSIDTPVRVENSTGFAEFLPAQKRTFDIYFDFGGRFQHTNFEGGFIFDLDQDNFHEKIANARTFGLYEDAMHLQAMGLAKGSSLDNTIILKDMHVLNTDGLRSPDEFIRHKMLDALGDIALANCAIIGAYKAFNPSHDLNNKLLRAVFNNKE